MLEGQLGELLHEDQTKACQQQDVAPEAEIDDDAAVEGNLKVANDNACRFEKNMHLTGYGRIC